MLYEIREKIYRPAQPGEDFGDYDFRKVATIEAASERAAQSQFKKSNPRARFDRQTGRFACWPVR